MTLAERILTHIENLPRREQAKVLDFVERLEGESDSGTEGRQEWSRFSLAQALRGMEDEETGYSLEDLRETF